MPGEELQLHPGSYVDPAGQLYESGNTILRGIREPFARFYADVLHNPSIRPMIGQQIVETDVEPNGLAGYALTLRHRKLTPLSFCYEWPPTMLREAALMTLDISERLVDAEMALQDGSPWNIVFDGPRPVFVDFTSLAPQDSHLLWVAYDQFCHLFLYPLALYSVGLGRVARALLLDSINGISEEELRRLLPSGATLRLPWLVSRVYMPRLALAMIRRLSNDRALGEWSKRLSPGTDARRAFYRALRKDVQAVPLPNQRSRWAGYYADVRSFFRPAEFNPKQATVVRILQECHPKTVVDIGCNQGGYSVLAAQAGARVTAFDTDEDSVSLLHELACKEKLDILPLVMDVLNPSPACGWRAMQFPPALQRFRSEMALALALVHHLAITQHQTFERIVPALADYADKWLLTEFVPLDDPRCQELLATHRRDMSWYSLEGFIAALQCMFSEVKTLPSYPEGRVLVLCVH